MGKGTSYTLNTGETLRWDSGKGECAILRGEKDIIAVFHNLNGGKVESTPPNALYLITPKCAKEITRLFPDARLPMFGRKPKRKKDKKKGESRKDM